MKIINLILFVAILVSCKQVVHEPLHIALNFRRPTLKEIDSIENASNGIRVYKPYKISVSKDYFPNADTFNLGPPLLFIRDTSSSKTAITYFYSEPDSLIRLVEFSWNSTGRNKNVLESIFRINDSTISKELNMNGIMSTKKQDSWTQVTKIWDTDSVFVEQFILIQGEPNRVRVLVSWK